MYPIGHGVEIVDLLLDSDEGRFTNQNHPGPGPRAGMGMPGRHALTQAERADVLAKVEAMLLRGRREEAWRAAINGVYAPVCAASLWQRCEVAWPYMLPSHPIPSHPIPSHPIPSHPIPSHPIPSHPIPSHPIPFRPSVGVCPRHCTASQRRRRPPIAGRPRPHRPRAGQSAAGIVARVLRA
jgi:hypothetical protein